jgi:DNA-binding response OmpR family regulator
MPQSDASFKPIIFAEDDPSFREMICKYLQTKGYEITPVGSAIDFYKEFKLKPYGLAIIDIGLPDQSGLVISKYVRANSTARVILLSGDTSLDARIAGYEAGADIFLTKPLNFRLLDAALGSTLMRVAEENAVLSGKGAVKPENSGDSHVWVLRTEVWDLIPPCGERLHLTSKEKIFLQALAEAPNAPVSRNALLDKLGYTHDEFGNRSLESMIYRLRKKISPNLETPIKTANGSGYIFTAKIVIEN